MKLKDTYTNNDFDNFLSEFKLNDKFLSFLNQHYQKQVITKYDGNKYIYEKYNIDLNNTYDLVYVYFNDLEIEPYEVFEVPYSGNGDSNLGVSRNDINKMMRRNDIEYSKKLDRLNNEELYQKLKSTYDHVYENDPCITSSEIKQIIDEYSKKNKCIKRCN